MATKKTNKGAQLPIVEDIPHEIVNNQVSALSAPAELILTAEQKAEKEVARFDVSKAWISERKEMYKDLKIAGLEDRTGQTAVHKAWQEVRNKRLQVEKRHKDIKADYLVITRRIDGAKNELVGLLEEIEDPLKAELDRIENEKTAILQQKEREAQEKLQGRVAQLIENGMAFNGQFYAIGDKITIDVVTLKSMPDSEYEMMLKHVKTVDTEIKEAAAKKQLEDQQERDRVQAQKDENERLEKKLKQDREDLERQQKAAKEMRTKTRAKLLQAIGMTFDYTGKRWHYTAGDLGTIEISLSVVEDGEDEAFAAASDAAEGQVISLKAKHKEIDDLAKADQLREDKRREMIAERVLQLGQRFGMVRTPSGKQLIRQSQFGGVEPLILEMSLLENAGAETWLSTLKGLDFNYSIFGQMEIKAQEKEKADKEATRLAALSDVQRAREWITGVMTVIANGPVIESKDLKATHKFYFESLNSSLNNYLNDLTEFEK